MDINARTLDGLFNGFNTSFNKGLANAETHHGQVTMDAPSTGETESYSWLAAFPGIREWIGDRIVHNLGIHSYAITNRDFEETVSIPRNKIMDDKFGIFGPVMEKMGQDVAQHPDKLTFGLMRDGFTTKCYDRQNFFDEDHPVIVNGKATSVSNVDDPFGAGEPWFLLDCSQAIKPFIYQKRMPFRFVALNDAGDENVFWKKEYVYGVDGRCNVGFGLWQLAYASRAPLDAGNYERVRAAMRNFRSDTGEPLGVKPTHLVVSPNMEGAAMRLLNNGSRLGPSADGSGDFAISNEWANTAEAIITPYVVPRAAERLVGNVKPRPMTAFAVRPAKATGGTVREIDTRSATVPPLHRGIAPHRIVVHPPMDSSASRQSVNQFLPRRTLSISG